MEQSGFFNSINGDRRYKAEIFAQYFASFIGNGVFPNPSTNLQITENNDMTITISPGKAWINGYFYINSDELILPIDPADGVLNRVDRVVLRLDVIERKISAKVKKGQFGDAPNPPELQRDDDAYELGLADIEVNKGVISITGANITDFRLNTELCGIVHATIDQVDTTTIFNQFQSWYSENTQSFRKDWETWFYYNTGNWETSFIEWFDDIKGYLVDDAAAFLANEIMEIKSVLTEVESTELATIEHGLNRYPTSLLIHNEYAAGIGGTGVGPAGGSDGFCINHKIFYPSLNSIKVQVPNIYKNLELDEVIKIDEEMYYLIFKDGFVSMTLILK